jgi:membrane protease YdiL (CAAX protease family)
MIAEIADIQEHLHEKWLIFWYALGVSLWVLAIAWRRGFFKPFQASSYPIIRGVDVLKGFGCFLFAEILLLPALIGLFFLISGMDFTETMHLHPQIKGWMNLLIILGGFIGVSVAYLELKPMQRQQLWYQTDTPWYIHIGMGIVAWVISYPMVLALSEGVSLTVWHFFHHSFVEQVAVQNVRHVKESPLLFGLTSFSIVTLVPLTEEFLFRGLLQSWFKQKFHNTTVAVVCASFIFALFHFSKKHGITNIELLSSLFLLSCMLGYIYERQRSLWASVGLHGFFNFMSLLMISQET